MIVRRAVIVSVVLATGIVASSGVAAGAEGGMHASDVLTSIEAAKPLTQAQFVARANALCTASVTAFASELSQFSGIKKNHSPAEIAAFVKALSPIIQSQINKTKDLSPPKSERAAVTKMLKANQTDLNMVKADPALLGASTSPFAVADSQARKLGLIGAAGSGPCSKGSP